MRWNELSEENCSMARTVSVIGGSDVDVTVLSGGLEILSSGGSAANTLVDSGGQASVSSRGIASDTTVGTGGVAVVYAGGLQVGGQVLNGPDSRGSDVGFRLWDVKERRQPAKQIHWPEPPARQPEAPGPVNERNP